MIDEIQLVANARAAMLQRGFEPLRVMIGPDMLARLRRDAPEYIEERIDGTGRVLGMPCKVSADMEGFAVVYDERGGGL